MLLDLISDIWSLRATTDQDNFANVIYACIRGVLSRLLDAFNETVFEYGDELFELLNRELY